MYIGKRFSLCVERTFLDLVCFVPEAVLDMIWQEIIYDSFVQEIKLLLRHLLKVLDDTHRFLKAHLEELTVPLNTFLFTHSKEYLFCLVAVVKSLACVEKPGLVKETSGVALESLLKISRQSKLIDISAILRKRVMVKDVQRAL